MYMVGTVSTSSLALFLIVATTLKFSALHLAELGAWLYPPLTASSWSSTVGYTFLETTSPKFNYFSNSNS